jgi:hypothetical protein
LFYLGFVHEFDVSGMCYAMGDIYPMELPKPNPDIGRQPGQTAVYPDPGV